MEHQSPSKKLKHLNALSVKAQGCPKINSVVIIIEPFVVVIFIWDTVLQVVRFGPFFI